MSVYLPDTSYPHELFSGVLEGISQERAELRGRFGSGWVITGGDLYLATFLCALDSGSHVAAGTVSRSSSRSSWKNAIWWSRWPGSAEAKLSFRVVVEAAVSDCHGVAQAQDVLVQDAQRALATLGGDGGGMRWRRVDSRPQALRDAMRYGRAAVTREDKSRARQRERRARLR